VAAHAAGPFGHLFRGLIGNSAMIIFFLSIPGGRWADANALSFASPLFITALSNGRFWARPWGGIAGAPVAVGSSGRDHANPSGDIFSAQPASAPGWAWLAAS